MNANDSTAMVSPLSTLWFWAGFHARRTIKRNAVMLGIMGAVVLALVLRLFSNSSPEELRVFVMSMVVPLFAMFFGTGGLREEIEDQTLTYAFTRPQPRGNIFLARTLAAVLVTLVPMSLGALIAFEGPLELPRDLAVGVLAIAGYTAVFAVLGLVLRRPTLVGLGVLVWDQIVGGVPGFLSRLTLRAHVHGLLGVHPASSWLRPNVEPPAWWISLPTLVLVTAAALALGRWWVNHRELVVPK
jgi:hypothetical protein